ncbi:MAG: CheR family methyltransferase [Candidatus Nitrosocaldus sp.]
MIDEYTYERLREIIKTRAGVDISCYSTSFIARRLECRMNACNIKDHKEYIRLLELECSDEINIFVASLSINVTEFFRDPDVFDRFRDILRGYNYNYNCNNVKIWSVGCASGEEPYTIAIVAKSSGVRCSILASDISKDAIAYAMNGVYSSKSLKNVPKDILERYFTATTNGYMVRKEIRDMVTFEVRDVTNSAPEGYFDFIFCRNMLIYMDYTNRNRIMSNICSVLKQNGYLILGKSEYISNNNLPLSCVDTRTKIYRKIFN